MKTVYLQIHLVVERNHRVVRSGWGHFAWIACATVVVQHEHLPSIIGHLQLVKVKCREIVHKDAFDLTAEDVDFGSQDVQGVAITA